MARQLLWICDDCRCESRSDSLGWLVVKEFRQERPKFYSFCCWNCLTSWLKLRKVPMAS